MCYDWCYTLPCPSYNTDCPIIEYTVCKIEIFFNRRRIMWAPKGPVARGSRSIFPQKMLKSWCFEIPFLVLWEENMSKNNVPSFLQWRSNQSNGWASKNILWWKCFWGKGWCQELCGEPAGETKCFDNGLPPCPSSSSCITRRTNLPGTCTQGSYGSWKNWKVMKFKNF